MTTAGTRPAGPWSAGLAYPQLERRDLVDEVGGVRFSDPHRQLEDDPCESWARAQVDLTRRFLDACEHRETAERAIRSLFDLPRRTVPARRRQGLFRLRRLAGEQQASLVLDTGVEEVVLVDPAAESGETALARWAVSPCGGWLVHQTTQRGAEDGPLHIRHLTYGERQDVEHTVLPQSLAPALAWVEIEDRRVLLVGCGRPGDRHQRLVQVDPGSGAETELWSPPRRERPAFVVPVGVVGTGRIVVRVRWGSDPATEVHLIDPDGTARLFEEPCGLLRTTADGDLVVARPGTAAVRGGVALVPDGALDDGSWRWIAGPEATEGLANLAVTATSVVLLTVGRDGPRLTAYASDGSGARPLPLPSEVGTVSGLTGDVRGALGWFEFSDLVRPHAVFQFDTRDGSVTPLDPGAAPAAPDVVARRLVVDTADGEEVDLTLVEPARLDQRQTACVLSVYGGFGRPMALTYRADMSLWVRSGGSFAVAHVRGGGERGEAWHGAGRGAAKARAVDDLVAAAELLVSAGVAAPERLVLTGASNGGLLATAAAVRRPELFAACVALAPVTDLARFHLIGHGDSWCGEYGDPRVPDELARLLELSPYHRVRKGVAYPAFLLSVGTNDQRVTPVHARKLAAALQDATSSDPSARPVLLREDGRYGHAPGSAASRIDYGVDQAVFLWQQTGVRPAPGLGADEVAR